MNIYKTVKTCIFKLKTLTFKASKKSYENDKIIHDFPVTLYNFAKKPIKKLFFMCKME